MESRWLLTALLVLAATLFCAGVWAFLWIARAAHDSESNPQDVESRLRARMATRNDWVIHVGVPLEKPVRWAMVDSYDDSSLVVEGLGSISPAAVREFVVAYPNRQMVDSHVVSLDYPEAVTGLSPGRRQDSDTVEEADLEIGAKWVEVAHGPVRRDARGETAYSTTLTNVSGERVRVLRFAGYHRVRGRWVLSTVTGQFYSPDEFRSWYGLTDSEWLQPGESATDPDNYGGPRSLWAYYCESESGERFVAGGIVE